MVRAKIGGRGYQVVAGERRFRASKMLGLSEVPVIIKEINDLEAAEIALVENLQRENLNPIEEAVGYQDLMKIFDLNQEEVSKKVGKSRPAVANSLRLLNLSEKTSNLVKHNKLSAGHARTLLGLSDKNEIDKVAAITIEKGFSVRETENFVRRQNKESGTPTLKTSKKHHTFTMGSDTYYVELEAALKNELGRRIKIEHKGEEKGIIQIHFHSKEDAKEIAEKLTKNP